jgi:hypothetical protein
MRVKTNLNQYNQSNKKLYLSDHKDAELKFKNFEYKIKELA